MVASATDALKESVHGVALYGFLFWRSGGLCGSFFGPWPFGPFWEAQVTLEGPSWTAGGSMGGAPRRNY